MNCPAFSLGTSQNKSPKPAAPGNSQVSRRPQLSALGSSLRFHTPCWYIGGSKPLHPHMNGIWMPQSAVARSRVGCVAAASWRGVWTLGMPLSRRSIRFARKKRLRLKLSGQFSPRLCCGNLTLLASVRYGPCFEQDFLPVDGKQADVCLVLIFLAFVCVSPPVQRFTWSVCSVLGHGRWLLR